MQTIHILQIDDNKEHCDRLKNLAWHLGKKQELDVQVKDFQNLEEGYIEFEKEIKYKAVILDAQCVIKKGENHDFNFLPKALRELEKINRKTDRIFTPFAVNTGYYGYETVKIFARDIEEQNGKLFDKSDEENMLIYLFKEISKSDNTKIEKEFSDVFEVFDNGYLENDFRIKLLTILKNIGDESKTNSNLKEVRYIQDGIYDVINHKNNKIVPNGSFTDKNKHLSGHTKWDNDLKRPVPTKTVYQTDTISYLANAIYRISSDFGVHPLPKPTKVTVEYWEMPSKYAVKGLVFGLLEQLLWFKHLMEKP